MAFKDLVNNKKNYEQILYTFISTYCIKYIKKIYALLDDNKNIYKIFQYKLIKISEWDDDKQLKEYNKWISWCKQKHDYKENKIQNIFNMYILLSIQIITYNNLKNNDELSHIFPELYQIFYKCLKHMAKYFYENPKIIKNNDISIQKIEQIIKYQLQKVLPFNKILNILKNKEEPSLFIEYNFDKTYSESNHSNDNNITNKDDLYITNQSLFCKNHKNNNLIVEKENTIDNLYTHNNDDKHLYIHNNDDENLYYVDSDNFENEYYESTHNSNKENEHDEIKHIDIQKHNKKNFNV